MSPNRKMHCASQSGQRILTLQHIHDEVLSRLKTAAQFCNTCVVDDAHFAEVLTHNIRLTVFDGIIIFAHDFQREVLHC